MSDKFVTLKIGDQMFTEPMVDVTKVKRVPFFIGVNYAAKYNQTFKTINFAGAYKVLSVSKTEIKLEHVIHHYLVTVDARCKNFKRLYKEVV